MSLGTFAMLAFLAIPALFIIDIFGMGKKADNITFLIWAGIPIILFVVFTIFNISDIPSLKRDYKKSVADYEATWKKLQDRVDKERIEKKLLIEEKDSLYEIYQKQKKLLSDMYNLAIIHPKYRNWVAIASFYDYFDCGICSTMAGHEGAYNKYDEDLKFGILFGKLNEVIDMLGDIRSKQETICHMIEDGNRKSQKLLADSVRYSQQACEISSSAQYYNQINADNTRMLLFLEAYNTFKQ